MRILISNDDGYLATGLELLAQAVAPLAQEVLVVAPERDRSGASSSLTLDRPLFVHESLNGFYYVNGTPTDCVHLALTGLFTDRLPDLVLSGINRGANMGDDTIYSGTVAAAMEAHLFNIPAIAFSLCSRSRKHLPDAAKVAQSIVRWFIQYQSQWPRDILLNVNIPNTGLDAIKDWRITRLGKRHKAENTILAKTPNGETVYWIGASGAAQDAGEGTDFHAIQNECISITPLMADLTNQLNISKLSQHLPPFTRENF